MKKNYYGSLCTEMYEILHEKAPEDELYFYLSYAKTGHKILEALCGSGRFLIPFLERGFNIRGIDNSREMLNKLKLKLPDAVVINIDIERYQPDERFDYIFISSGSVSLFTDMEICRSVLKKLNAMLGDGGKFVFAVDTVASRRAEDAEYKLSVSVKTKENYDLILKSKNHYDEKTNTQFSPGIYELYNGKRLLQRERMDFQTHLYRLGEMENLLKEAGFTKVAVYSSFDKSIAADNRAEMFLYECDK